MKLRTVLISVSLWMTNGLLQFASASSPPILPPLSSRAEQLLAIYSACAARREFKNCTGWSEIRNRCLIRAHWEEPDCAAFREHAGALRMMKGKYDGDVADRREKCKEGDQEACRLAPCPAYLDSFGSDADLITCAKLEKQKYTKVWIRTGENVNGTPGYTAFTCLKRTEEVTDFGEHLPTRISFRLLPDSSGKPVPGYTDYPSGNVYATAEEAATAACPLRIQELKEKNAAKGSSR